MYKDRYNNIMTSISDKIKDKLLPYQLNHTQNLINSLKKHHRVLDASDTGTGKTYTAIATCIELGLKPLIICPKSVITSWYNVIECFNYHESLYGIANYELIKNGRFFNKWKEKITCPFINLRKVMITNKRGKPDIIDSYVWNLPDDIIIIIDEAHSCKNNKTFNSQLLTSLTDCVNLHIMIISATICDSLDSFRNYGLLMGFYKTTKELNNWYNQIGKTFLNRMIGIRHFLFPEYASRMSIKELGDLFPENQIIAKAYFMKEAIEIDNLYKIIEEAQEELKRKKIIDSELPDVNDEPKNKLSSLAKITDSRQKIEYIKIPTIVELAQQFLDEGNSVVIFVNFTETLFAIGQALKTTNFIYGEQTQQERDLLINLFQTDKERIIIANIKAGGLGISLHDINGNFPRVSIISPSWSASNVLQALGRIFRAKGQTPVRQRLIYCQGTCEEAICKSMTYKINNIACLNDGNNKNYIIKGLNENDIEEELDPLIEMKKIEMKINTLTLKRDRLALELRNIELELRSMEYIYDNYKQKKASPNTLCK